MAFALFAQMLMPASMARAAALASDPLAHMIICGQSAADDGQSQNVPPSASSEHCPFCVSAGGGGFVVAHFDFQIELNRLFAERAARNPDRLDATRLWVFPQAPPTGPPSVA